MATALLGLAGHGINGRWFHENYHRYIYSFNQVQNMPFTLGTFNAGHPLMAGVSTLNSNYQNIVTLTPQATEVAAASNGNALVAIPGQQWAHDSGCHRLHRSPLRRAAIGGG